MLSSHWLLNFGFASFIVKGGGEGERRKKAVASGKENLTFKLKLAKTCFEQQIKVADEVENRNEMLIVYYIHGWSCRVHLW